jgi:hypothetical protein
MDYLFASSGDKILFELYRRQHGIFRFVQDDDDGDFVK